MNDQVAPHSPIACTTGRIRVRRGGVVLVGGNIEGDTQTLASAVLVRVSAGEYGRAIALGTFWSG